MLLLIIRTVLLYIISMIAIKIMGKRQMGQLQPFEFVVVLIVSEVAAISMQYSGIPLFNSIVPIATITILQIATALVNMKSEKARKFICGNPSVVIKDGKIEEEEMKRLRINVNDLLEQMRAKGFFNIAEVEYAIMETNGQLSVMPRADKRPLQPSDINLQPQRETPAVTLILDGQVDEQFSNENDDKIQWLKGKLSEHHINSINDVFYASIDDQGNLFCQLKSDVKFTHLKQDGLIREDTVTKENESEKNSDENKI